MFDYLPPATALVVDEPDAALRHLDEFNALVESAYGEAVAAGRPVMPPETMYLPAGELSRRLVEGASLRLGELALQGEDDRTRSLATLSPTRYRGDAAAFVADLRARLGEGYTVTLAAATQGGAERLERMLADHELGARRLEGAEWSALLDELLDSQPSFTGARLFLTVGAPPQGFVIPSGKWAVITGDEIFGRAAKVMHRARAARKTFGATLAELSKGDLVAHRVHGVGRYLGTKEMVIADRADEYLEIEYAERQRLFLPIRDIDLLRRFTGASPGGAPPLDRMGGATWKKTRAKVKKSLLEMAGELLKIHAARELAQGAACAPDGPFHREFAGSFEYVETSDQLAAIMDLTADMEKPRPMDRLICGDVGYGKTEVAMRAAFKAVFEGRQVAVLVPTTLLAQQHFQTFSERFKSFPVRVESLSRFKQKKEQNSVVARLAAGEVDILIGTHRLLQPDVKFKNLGLVVIDEEQRFGVKHKERLRAMRKSVDALTLTATPIPRTLHSALLGIRDLSVIETPPPDRQSIRTIIAKFSGKVIREAVIRELDRGGQIFFVHNKVRTIGAMARYLRQLVPQARVEVAHGQMAERELEKVMLGFMNREFDALVCTTIIESGLDIPSANTILINRADHFGLAQLYQLRGRVGRDRHRSYGYLLIPGEEVLTPVARQRLKAMEELSELGSGFKLAARDMEIRGAGNLLGAAQSGHIDAVGFDTYCEMLEGAIRELKGEPVEEAFEVDMNLPFTGRLSPEYVPDLGQRIDLHQRIASAAPEQIGEIRAELRDRFGPPPEEVEKLLLTAEARALAKRLKVEKVDLIRDRMFLAFNAATTLAPARLVTEAYQAGMSFKFAGENVIEYPLKGAGWRERGLSLTRFLAFLSERV